MIFDSRIDALAAALDARARIVSGTPPESARHPTGREPAVASVALVVRPQPRDLELLLIKRAIREGDPWSGHMAFPGGRRGPLDRSDRETAERETQEEVGIELKGAGRLLGPLQPVAPRAGGPLIVVTPFVFAVPTGVSVTSNHEVAAAFWIPLGQLSEPGAATEYLHALEDGEELRFPAIAYESHVIWGLTHRIMSEFLEIVRAGTRTGERL